MDSKSSDDTPEYPIEVASNVWTRDEEDEIFPWSAAKFVPGDLMVELIGTRDERILPYYLTPAQIKEYHIYRFFLYHGQQGLAFET